MGRKDEIPSEPGPGSTSESAISEIPLMEDGPYASQTPGSNLVTVDF